MRALTVWQPWATLIILGAKPYEFRKWDYRSRAPALVGQRVAIHAGARLMHPGEVIDIADRLDNGDSALNEALARPILDFIFKAAAADAKGARRCLPLSAVLGTAVIGAPVKVTELFAGKADSDRLDHSMFAWPMTDIVAFDQPVPYRGAQGFWTFPDRMAEPQAKVA